MLISKAILIPGWMQAAELEWLSDQATTHNLIVEIGSFLGRSTRALGDNTKGKVIAVDDWYGPRNEGETNVDGSPFTKEAREELFDRFNEHLSDLIDEGKVLPVKLDYADMEYSEELDVQPDFVFIDGSHKYEDVKRDIELWEPRLVPGGLLSGHDCSYEPIVKALQDCNLKVNVATGTSIWWCIKGGK